MPLFSRARAELALPSPHTEGDGAVASSPPSNTSHILARMLREALSALERPRLSSEEIALHVVRLAYRKPDPRDLEL